MSCPRCTAPRRYLVLHADGCRAFNGCACTDKAPYCPLCLHHAFLAQDAAEAEAQARAREAYRQQCARLGVEDARRDADLTLADVAARSGVSTATIARLEHGELIGPKYVRRICGALGIALPEGFAA